MTRDAEPQTVITTFETNPGHCQDLLGELTDAYGSFISKRDGFINAAIHVNYAQTRVAIHSRWASREDFQAMLRSEEMQKRSRRINGFCRGFEPVLYDVEATFIAE